MKRRSFLKTAGAVTLGTNLLGGVPLRAFSPYQLVPVVNDQNERILIVIQLFGGNDGLNTIVPVEDDRYYAIRPGIGVKKEDAVQVLGRVHMHPALDPANVYNMRRMLEDGRLAVVQNVGYENPNLSHFRSTDIWLSGFNSSDPNDRLIDGWLGRYFSRTLNDFPTVLPDHPLAVQVGGTLSMLFQSPKGDIGIALTDPDKFFELGQGLSPDLAPMSEDSRYGREFNFVRLVAEQSDRYSTVVKEAFDRGRNTISYANNGFVKQLQLVARLISGGLKSKMYMVYMGGFDTHVQQQADDNTGLHPFLLQSLSTGVGQFMEDMLNQGHAEKIVGLTASEFGRRPEENGSRGTDHGAASVQFVFGPRVSSGVFGSSPNLDNLDGNGDVRHQNDFRRIYADVLETWFGGSPDDTEAVFGERILPLGVLQQTTSIDDAYRGAGGVSVTAFPNPSTGSMTLSWNQQVPANVTVDVWTMDGRHAETLHRGWHSVGDQRIVISPGQSGTYLCSVRMLGTRSVVPITVTR
ncbi:MAG: DUF1501 domain-containing protein [Candidatus Kapabacteria bacterium]|nr:DUF1501 domain-containing protein [Candidatus Kapabacteria bacterium]